MHVAISHIQTSNVFRQLKFSATAMTLQTCMQNDLMECSLRASISSRLNKICQRLQKSQNLSFHADNYFQLCCSKQFPSLRSFKQKHSKDEFDFYTVTCKLDVSLKASLVKEQFEVVLENATKAIFDKMLQIAKLKQIYVATSWFFCGTSYGVEVAACRFAVFRHKPNHFRFQKSSILMNTDLTKLNKIDSGLKIHYYLLGNRFPSCALIKQDKVAVFAG